VDRSVESFVVHSTQLQEFLASLEEQNGGEWCQRNQCQLVVPAVRGIASYAMGDYDHAYELLAPVMRDLKQVRARVLVLVFDHLTLPD